MTLLIVTLVLHWTTPGYDVRGHVIDRTANTKDQCEQLAADYKARLTPEERKSAWHECLP